jgi:hypothetical protein
MRKHSLISTALIGSLALAPLAGCESLPGNAKEQGAVIGGVGGALAGAALAKNERGLGALIGGVLGAGGGYLIGAQKDKLDKKKRDEAIAANKRAESNPAKPEDVDRTRTADLNSDGFVTLDEVVAMERANLSDREMLDRLERTGQVFELTDEQERYLEDRGVSRSVVLELRHMNQPSDHSRTASARQDATYRRDQERLTDRPQGNDRVRENDRPRDFQDVRQEVGESNGVARSGSGEREKF